jgi:hypothetical protein
MAVDITRDLRAWALRGAEQRLVEIAEEAAAIHRTFPELRDRATAVSAGGRQGTATPQRQGQPGRRKGRRRNLSPEGRNRIAEAARKRWAEWKAKQGQSSEAAPAAAASAGRAPKKR